MFDFVCLIYYNKKEFELLKIQLFSFKFIEINIINNIYILFNDNKEKIEKFNEDYKNNIQTHVPLNLLQKVKIIYITDLIFLNEIYISDWFSQQFAKIYISNIVTSKYYIVLDSKNIFIKNIDLTTFMTNDKINLHYSTHDEALLNYYNNCFEYFELTKYNPYTEPLYIQTTTPFVLITKECKNLINFVENKEKNNLYYFFKSRKYTEFFLYFAWLRFTNNNEYIFLNRPINNVIIGPRDPNVYVWNSWQSKIKFINQWDPSIFSISSKCVEFIDSDYKNNIIIFFDKLFGNENINNALTTLLFHKNALYN
jgi:hypothetical protein